MLLFGRRPCEKCAEAYDMALSHCPKCGAESQIKEARRFDNFHPLGTKKELIVLALGTIGLTLISLIVQIAMLSKAPDLIKADSSLLEAWFYEPEQLAILQYVSYGAALVVMALIVFEQWEGIFRKINWRTLIVGLIGFLSVFVAQLACSYILEAAETGATDNANQTYVVELIEYSPGLAVLFLAIIGPVVEELTYRVGLFGVLKRIHPAVAYVAVSIIFGFIHFDLTNMGDVNEWLNLPVYVISGLLLAITYDKGGFGASALAHILYNLTSVLLIAYA